MAKSLRSKVKQAAGRKRRSDSHYAVAEAARIQRLSDKLMEKSKAEKESKEAAEVEVEGDDAKMADGESLSQICRSPPQISCPHVPISCVSKAETPV